MEKELLEIHRLTGLLKNDIQLLLLQCLINTYGSKKANKLLKEEPEDWETFVQDCQAYILTEIDMAIDDAQYNFLSLSED